MVGHSTIKLDSNATYPFGLDLSIKTGDDTNFMELNYLSTLMRQAYVHNFKYILSQVTYLFIHVFSVNIF